MSTDRVSLMSKLGLLKFDTHQKDGGWAMDTAAVSEKLPRPLIVPGANSEPSTDRADTVVL